MKIALVNSRKPRQFHPDEPWLSKTMALGYAIGRAGHTLCASVGTIGYESALFGAAMGRGQIEAFVHSGEDSNVLNCFPQNTPPNLASIRLIDAADSNREEQRDRDVMDAADVVIAVAIRTGGLMEKLLQNRFHAGKKIYVVVPEDDGPLWRGTRKLLEMGVPPVDEDLLRIAEENIASRRMIRREEFDWRSFFPIWSDAPLSNPTLSHFTRAAQGPWPGQKNSEYLEDIWFGGVRARRDAPAALWRILQMSTLKASPRLIRGHFPVVSFTAVSPARINALHRYRSHLVRWDFEPWGIVFDRDWLAKQHARPVQYLPSASFRNLEPTEKAFFQKHEPPACDYSLEEEWRIPSDFHFAHAPKDVVRIVCGH